MKHTIRELTSQDREAWCRMRLKLWPGETADAHIREIDAILSGADMFAYGVETEQGETVGFLELAIRNYANGCTACPVPFLEGIWIDEGCRRQGFGAALVRHAEARMCALGFTEICSDTGIDNARSIATHMRWGFAETERVVYFRKSIGADEVSSR